MNSLLSLLSGFLLTSAYAPFGFVIGGVLAVFIAVGVFVRCSTRQAWVQGALLGLAHFGSSVYWVYHSLHQFGGSDAWFALSATVLFVAILAVYFVMLAVAVAWGYQRLPRALFYWLWFPSLWVAMEYLRSELFSGFAWNLLGQSWVEVSWFGVFPWFGVLGASWVVAFLAVTLFVLLFEGKRLRLWALHWLVVLVLSCFAMQTVAWSKPIGEPIQVGIVQSGIQQNIKFDPIWFKEIVQRHHRMTAELRGRDLIVWAETALPSDYATLSEKVLMPIYNQSIRGQGELLTGIFYHDEEEGKFYNSIARVGDEPSFYHKQHLVPFGEYIPLRWLLDFFRDYVLIPMSDLGAGQQRGLLQVGAYQVGMSICYEVIFADEMKETLPEANYFVNVSNDSWFGESSAAAQHLQMAQVRSREGARAMVRAASTGISALIDHQGRIVKASTQHVAENLVGEIQAREGETLFAHYGHNIIMSTIIVLLSLCLISMIMRRRKEESVL